ncbi:hypothetical protein FQN54_005537 [Arachnomyces sp. PD_36]|nr:hypothetical protein FQN54_005537 [Arachnomyces sp. PD_36]
MEFGEDRLGLGLTPLKTSPLERVPLERASVDTAYPGVGSAKRKPLQTTPLERASMDTAYPGIGSAKREPLETTPPLERGSLERAPVETAYPGIGCAERTPLKIAPLESRPTCSCGFCTSTGTLTPDGSSCNSDNKDNDSNHDGDDRTIDLTMDDEEEDDDFEIDEDSGDRARALENSQLFARFMTEVLQGRRAPGPLGREIVSAGEQRSDPVAPTVAPTYHVDQGAQQRDPTYVREIYDPDGDMILVARCLGQRQDRHLQVCMKRLASTSKVWSDLISDNESQLPSMSEATTALAFYPSITQDWRAKMEIYDDDPRALSIFLDIIHLRFTRLPLSVTFDELYKIAQFSEKYGVYETFLPFAEKWAGNFLNSEELNSNRPEWVLIAWEFCEMGVFMGWVHHFCWEAEKNVSQILMYRGMDVANYFPESCREKYMGYIRKTRESLILGLLNIRASALEGNHCVVNDSQYRDQCNAMKNGFLMTGLKNLLGREWQLEDAWWVSLSPRSIKNGLLAANFMELPVVGGDAGQEDHSECGMAALKHEIMAFWPDKEEEEGKEFWTIPPERAGKKEMLLDGWMLPAWKRMGFWREDFQEEIGGDGKYDDGRYRHSSPVAEPREEYESEGFEDCSDSDWSSDSDSEGEMDVDSEEDGNETEI